MGARWGRRPSVGASLVGARWGRGHGNSVPRLLLYSRGPTPPKGAHKEPVSEVGWPLNFAYVTRLFERETDATAADGAGTDMDVAASPWMS